MRDILPIAHFECLQKSNWHSGIPHLDAYRLCELVYPIRVAARNTPVKEVMGAEYILDLCMSFANCLEGCIQPEFRNPSDWKEFLDEWTVECDLEEMQFSEAGSYLLASLFHRHLTTLGLLTSWTILDVLNGHIGRPPLQIAQEGLGRLMKDLSLGGPPIFDVEDMRSEFPDRYSR